MDWPWPAAKHTIATHLLFFPLQWDRAENWKTKTEVLSGPDKGSLMGGEQENISNAEAVAHYISSAGWKAQPVSNSYLHCHPSVIAKPVWCYLLLNTCSWSIQNSSQLCPLLANGLRVDCPAEKALMLSECCSANSKNTSELNTILVTSLSSSYGVMLVEFALAQPDIVHVLMKLRIILIGY